LIVELENLVNPGPAVLSLGLGVNQQILALLNLLETAPMCNDEHTKVSLKARKFGSCVNSLETIE
jgi:hypothetical protein